jgi:flagellar protein FlaJ
MKSENLIMIISAVIAIVFFVFSVIAYMKGGLGPLTWLDLMVFGIAGFLIGPGAYDFVKTRRIKKIEERFPDFLRDVAESGRFGMTLTDAIIVASSGRYGALTDEIKRMAAKLRWGVPVKDVLLSFKDRVNTPLIDRITAIIIKSNEAGGNISDVLNMVAATAREEQISQKERGIEMFTYGFVLLTSFFVFLATIIILNKSFLPEMAKAGMAVEESLKNSAVSGVPAGIGYEYIPIIALMFVMATIIHAVGDGIMIGLLKDGRVKSGFIWAFALLLSGYLTLRLLGAM